MSKTTLVLFWVFWLLDVLLALFGHREFMNIVFGRYTGSNYKTTIIWLILLLAIIIILWASLYFKNQAHSSTALIIAGIPLALLLPYLLWMGTILVMGRNTNWH